MSTIPYAALLEGHDAGWYGLPDEVLDARCAVVRADQARDAHPAPDPGARQAELVERLLDGDQPDPAEVADLDGELARYQVWRILVSEAHETAGRRLSAAIGENRDRTIVEHLRPAHAESVETARDLASVAALADDPDVRHALAGTQRKKADQLVEAARRYGAVRAAWSVLTRGAATHDQQGTFGELRDLTDAWPTWRQHGSDRPWPSTPAARLAWIAVHATPWLPTPAEQDERYAEVFGDAERQAATNRAQARAFGGVFG